MSFFDSVSIRKFLDSTNLDPFGRLRISNPFAIFDSKQTGGHHLRHIKFVSQSVNSANIVYDQQTSSTNVIVAASSGSRAILQTRKRMNYFPGRGLLFINTFTLGTGSAGIVKRIGYFDETNGIFLEQSGSDINMVLRDNVDGFVKEERVSQSQWNIDPYDGSVSSSQPRALDFTKAQIFELDFQWLGAGRVRTAFVNVSGSDVPVHEFRHANSLENVYMRTPNLPVRVEVENYTGGSANSLKTICNAVYADGASNPIGFVRSVNTGTGSISITGNNRRAILSLKLQSGSLGKNVSPVRIDVLPTSNVDYRWELILNPGFASADNAAWQVVQNSSTEFDRSRTALVNAGTVLLSGFGSATNQRTISSLQELVSDFILGSTVNGVSDQISLVVTPSSTGTFKAALTYKEFD